MLKRLRKPEPFGKAGVTVAILALVLAMVGGAYAAGGLTKSQEKQVTKIAKKYAGKPGAPGAAGTNGTNGTNGTPGAKGENGTNGTPGAPGESVTVGSATNVECPSGGGAKLTNKTGTAKVCNGTTGFTETLPSGKTETGTYVVTSETGTGAVFGFAFGNISFNIPLAAPLDGSHVVLVHAGTTSTTCEGSVASPTAPNGFLCAYEGTTFSMNSASAQIMSSSFEPGAGDSGAILIYPPAAKEAYVLGSWAVTAE